MQKGKTLSKDKVFPGPDDRIRSKRHLRLRRWFAVPDKIIGLTPILDFIDRCTQNALLHLPLAAQSVLTQSKYLALLARCRIKTLLQKTQREPPLKGSSLCVATVDNNDTVLYGYIRVALELQPSEKNATLMKRVRQIGIWRGCPRGQFVLGAVGFDTAPTRSVSLLRKY